MHYTQQIESEPSHIRQLYIIYTSTSDFIALKDP